MRLKGKIAVITGGNSGIGFGIAQEFKNEGARGAILGRTRKTLDESIEKLGSDFIAIRGDVTRTDDLKMLYKQTTERFGKIDVLVVNAGGGIGEGTLAGMSVYSASKAGVRSFERTFSAELIDRKIRVNVLSPGTIDTPVLLVFA